jgi:type I restriction enzyme S subunit
MEVREPSAKYLARLRYKQTEVGVIPEDWKIARLGDLFEITSSKRVFQSEWKTEGVPFFRAREIAVLAETGFVDNDLFISKQMYDAFRRAYGVPQVGDLLVTGVGTLGKVYVVPDGRGFYFKDGNIIWFKIAGAICPAYLQQLYLTPVVVRQIADSSAGTTVGTYTISSAKKTVIPLPTKAEQEAIAEALSDANTLVEVLEQLLVKKREIKQGAMQELLTGKKRLPGFEIEPGYKQTESGEIPEDWGVSTVGAEFSIQLGKMLDAEKNFGTPKPFLGNRAVQWGRIDLSDIGDVKLTPSDIQRFRLREGDLLVCEGGEVGRAAIWRKPLEECYFQKALHRLRSIRGYNVQLMLNMLHRLASTGLLLSFVTQTSIAHLPKDKFETVPIPLPPTKAEQEAIATVLSDIDAEITALESKLAKARKLKQGMMQELLTGKIRLVSVP